MNLIAPLALWALCAVIAVLIIYFIRPKYRAKTVSGTFLWKLTLKYGKTNSKREILKSIILLLLQILVVSLLAFTMSRPTLTYTVKSGEKVIILDASVSMSASTNGSSRFERAVAQIKKIANNKDTTDKITLIAAADRAEYLTFRSDSAVYVSSIISGLECASAEADIESAVALAEAVLDENSEAEVILFTDKNYETPGFINVKNVAAGEWNGAVLELRAELKEGYYVISAQTVLYGKDADIAIKLFIDGAYKNLKLIEHKDGEKNNVVWDNLKIKDFDEISVVMDVEDSLKEDNEFVIFNETEVLKVQLVSDTPNFLSTILRASGRCKVDTVALGGEIKSEGYDLYVFEGPAPRFMPTDGAVWMFNPTLVLGDYGFRTRNDIKGSFTLNFPEEVADAAAITENIDASKITVSKYKEIIYRESNVTYETLLECNSAPILLSGTAGKIKILVFAFDIHNSNLPLLEHFPILIDNALRYDVPLSVEKKVYETGEIIEINAKPLSDELILKYNNESTSYSEFPVKLKAQNTGKYIVEQISEGEKILSSRFFVRINEKESDFNGIGGVLAKEEYNGNTGEAEEITIEISVYLAALLLLLLMAEWGLNYYGQH